MWYLYSVCRNAGWKIPYVTYITARKNDTATVKQTCRWHATAFPSQSCRSSLCRDRWCDQLENNVKDTTAKMSGNAPASVYTDLVWVQVRATLHRAYLLMHYINFIHCVSVFPRSKTCTAPPHQAGLRVKWLCSPPPARFTTHERPWDIFLHFLNTVHDRVWPPQGAAISIIPTGLVDVSCFTVSIKLSWNCFHLNVQFISPQMPFTCGSPN